MRRRRPRDASEQEGACKCRLGLSLSQKTYTSLQHGNVDERLNLKRYISTDEFYDTVKGGSEDTLVTTHVVVQPTCSCHKKWFSFLYIPLVLCLDASSDRDRGGCFWICYGDIVVTYRSRPNCSLSP